MPKNLEQPLINIIIAGTIISVLILPFVINDITFFPGNFARAILFRIIVEIFLIVYLALIFINKKYLPPFNLLTILVAGWWLVMGLATLFAAQPKFSFWGGVERMEGFFTMSHFFIFFFILAGTLKEKKQWLLILNSAILGSAVMSVIAILQHVSYTGTILGLSVPPLLAGTNRPPGTLENPIFLSGYLILFIFPTLMLLALGLKSLKNQQKSLSRISKILFYIVAFLLQFTALIYADSRGAYLAFFIGIFLFLFLFPIKNKLYGLVKFATVIISTSILVIFLLILVYPPLNLITQKLPITPRILTMTWGDFDPELRFYTADVALKALREKPILGYGPESFTLIFDRYFPTKFSSPELSHRQWSNRALNIVMDTLVSSGLLGLIIYLGVFFALIYKLFLKNRESILCFGLTITFIGYFIQNLGNMDIVFTYVPFFFFLAFSVYLISKNEKALVAKIKLPQILFPLLKNNNQIKFISITVLALMISDSIFFFNLQPLFAHRDIRKITQIAEENPQRLRVPVQYYLAHQKNILNGSKYLSYENSLITLTSFADQITTLILESNPEDAKEIIEKTIQVIEKDRDLRPHYSKPYMLLGTFYTKLAFYDEAAKQKAKENFEKATSLSPNRHLIWLEKTKSDILLKNYEGALQDAQNALLLITDASPYWGQTAETYLWLGIAYIYNGQSDIAQKYLSKEGVVKGGLINKNSLKFLSNAYTTKGDYKYLAPVYERLAELEPENLQWRASLAATYKELGEYNKACEEVRRLLKEPNIDPESRQAALDFLRDLSCD